MAERDIELIRAHSPQAKGRIERSFGTAQDRWVKKLRLAGVTTLAAANELLERLRPVHNRRFRKPARPADTRIGRTSGASDKPMTADISTVAKMRTFLLLPDTAQSRRLTRFGGRFNLEGRRQVPAQPPEVGMVKESVWSWVRWSPRRGRPAPVRYHLQVEVLEDRLTPTGPTATLTSAPDVPDVTDFPDYYFTVSYSDTSAIQVSSLGNNNILVAGGLHNFSGMADLVSVSPAGNSSMLTANYHVTLEHNDHCGCFNGTYSITLEPNQVEDVMNNFAPGGVLGTFQVTDLRLVTTPPSAVPPPTPPPPVHYLAVGIDNGVPQVNVYDAGTHGLVTTFNAFPATFTGGVRVAVGDVNGDGTPDIICAAGPGGGPEVRVFDGTNFQMIRDFQALPVQFTGGVFVAAGDVNGDGFADIICAADKGGGPQVTITSGKDGSMISSFYATASTFTGGIRVASGDINADGFADVIAVAGPGGGPQVTVFNGRSLSLLTAFYAYTPTFTGGGFVASGDVNGDGRADIVVGADRGGGPQVVAFDGPTQKMLASFYAMPASFTGGVRVAAVKPNGSTHASIAAAAGPGGGPQVQTFDGVTLASLDSFYAYPSFFTGGVFVGAS